MTGRTCRWSRSWPDDTTLCSFDVDICLLLPEELPLKPGSCLWFLADTVALRVLSPVPCDAAYKEDVIAGPVHSHTGRKISWLWPTVPSYSSPVRLETG